MVTSLVFIALIGTLQFNSAISAAINYEPIKIKVNENFYSQPGQVSPELQEPGVLHQGANFYFKPQLNLLPNDIPPHIEALISLIQQHHHSCSKDTSKVVVEKDKLIQILKPFMYPASEISKETLSEIVLEIENNLEIVNPIIMTEELKPVTPEFLVIPKPPVLPPLSNNGIPPVVEEVKKEESIIVEQPTGVFPTIPELAVINYVEPKPITSGLVVTPLLPPLSLNDIHVVEEEVTSVKPIVVDVERKPTTQELVAIPEPPVLTSYSFHHVSSIIEKQGKKEGSVILKEPVGVFPTIPEIDVRLIEEPIINYVEPLPITSELVVIPEAPVLPPLSLNGIPPIVEEEVKKEESLILEESTGILPEPTIIKVEPKSITSELVFIPEAPVLPPLSFNGIPPIVKEEVKNEESIILEESTGILPEPTIIEVEPKSITSELVVNPEAPVLPPLSFNGIPPVVKEEVTKEDSIILEESTGMLPEPTIIEVEPKPITSEFLVIPEAPLLPPLSLNNIHAVDEELKSIEPIVVGVEHIPAIQEFVAIPEAPVLPSYSLHDISYIIEKQAKKQESVIFEEPVGVFPTIPEIDVRLNEEPIINYVEPKAITSELVVIPEAPVLPPLSFNGIPPFVEEEVKKEESIILEETTGVLPVPTIIEVEPKPFTSELVVIPEAPVLPSLSLHDISSIIEEEMKKEESIILKKPTSMFSTIPEITASPTPEPFINYVEPKPITSELVVIPEAPVLPPLSFNGIPPVVEEEVKKIESIILEESTGILPVPTIIEVEPKPFTSELVVIPEAPVLPSLSLHDISSIIKEEMKKEESIILKKPTGLFSTIPKITVSPTPEPFINYVEPKPITSEHVVIPEAPELPPLSFNIPFVVEEEVKKEESVILEESTGVLPSNSEMSARPETIIVRPAIQELLVIPEATVLPPLSNSPVVEAIKLEESLILEESTDVSPAISDISVTPIGPEPIITDVEPRLITPELVVIPEAPVLPPLSYNGNPPVVENVKIEESITVEQSTRVVPSISENSPRPFPKPLVVCETAESFALENNIFPIATEVPIATEEVKIEVPILFEESIEVFPPIAEISSGPTFQESVITDCYALEEVSQPKPESVVTVKETLHPIIIPKPSNNLGVISYVPFVSHLSNRAPKAKKNMMPKPASLERFLLKKHPFRLPVTPFPKLDLNANAKSSKWGNKKQFLYPTSYAHDVIEKRIAPNMAFKKQNAPKRVKIYIRSDVPKGTSYL